MMFHLCEQQFVLSVLLEETVYSRNIFQCVNASNNKYNIK